MAKQKRPKAGIKRGKPNQAEDTFDSKTILESNEDWERLNALFDVTDEDDIRDIMDGAIGFDGY